MSIPRVFARHMRVLSALLSAAVCCCTVSANAEEPARLSRADSFFGIHFDFHAGETDQNIGANTTEEMVQTIIDMTRPDFIQVDSKGHAGWCSYPTKVGNPSPGVVTDSLKVWREVTARNGVALYTHYSGVWDNTAIARHPEWAVVNRSGARSKDITSVFSAYKTDLLIPQLLEFALDYGTDGVWVDGECWATQIDYSDAAVEAFKKATGRDKVPAGPSPDGQWEDWEGWQEWCNFHREAFREYLREYVSAVKEKAPNYQIASNWAFTDHMADPVSAPVDFISGDYSPNNSVNAARYSTRLMANQDKPWDLMAWSFATEGGWAQKTGVQLSREAACVLAQGGAFQAYYTQNRDGSVTLSKLESMAETAKFCRARQTLCQRSTGVPQVALFCPTASHYQTVSNGGESLFPMIVGQRPILYRLLENNYVVDVLTDAALTARLEEFPVVVFYRGNLCSEELKTKLPGYVKNGGSVVLIGNEPIEMLKDVFGEMEKTDALVKDDVWFLNVYTCGKGSVAMYPTPVGSPEEFVAANGPTFNEYLQTAMKKAFPKPMVEFAEKQPLDVSIRRTQAGLLTINLVNVSGPHETQPIINEIEPVDNVKMTLNLSERPQSLRLEPSGLDLEFEWENGAASFVVPSVPIHEIIVVK